mgnify:CR=1 FL=1
MDIKKITSLLPHRYPFLLVDRVVEVEPGQRLLGYKNVTINEPFFQGHFPEKPVMPGVLIIEALAQATGLLAMESEDPALIFWQRFLQSFTLSWSSCSCWSIMHPP